jgi:hypothetical protein
MYIIINETTQTRTTHEGNWPGHTLEPHLERGDRIIIISLYSNTIKVPYKVEYNGIIEWEWQNFIMFQTYNDGITQK